MYRDLIDTAAALELDADAFTAAMREECCSEFGEDDTPAQRAALYRLIREAE